MKELIRFEEGQTPNVFYVWTDLSLEDIKSVSGVQSVEESIRAPRFWVYYDPRYCVKKIKQDIRDMAEMQEPMWTHEDELQRRIDAAHKILDQAGISAGCLNVAERVERLVKKVARENRRANRLDKEVQNAHAEMTGAGFFGHHLGLVERVKQLLKRHKEMDDKLKELDQCCYALCIDKIEKRFYDLLIKVAEELVG
jgi:hypothetical protein